MSETNTGSRAACAVCGTPLVNSGQGWRRILFCSLECEQLAARRQLNQIASAAGYMTNKRPGAASGTAVPPGKAPPGHAWDAPTSKPGPR